MNQSSMYAMNASILAAATMSQELRDVPIAPKAHPSRSELSGEIYYSTTIGHADEFKPAIESMAKQIAAGIKVDYKDGVAFSHVPKADATERFGEGVATSRAEVFGLAVLAAVKLLPDAKRAQITLLLHTDKWLPKLS
jgi:hypothetical protein